MNFPQPGPPSAPYRGRFAPTPSGPLHLGSLLTALASWLDARAHDGTWLLRIDDLDAPRCPPGADDTILRQLEQHGLHWDETPRRQSAQVEAYAAAHAGLEREGLVYGCRCTRAVLAVESLPGPDGAVYCGRCREAGLPAGAGFATRLRLPTGRVELHDPVQGLLARDASAEIGDFVLRRSDGVIGYQLACVIDEREQGITRVLRGADLTGSSLRQRLLQRMLGQPSPAYAHLPVLLEPDGRKLSKQNGAAALDPRTPGTNIERCLRLLGQPSAETGVPVPELLAIARAGWQLQRVPKTPAIPALP